MKPSRLEHDTEIIKSVFEEYFDRDFECEIDASGTTAVLFVRKNAPSENMPIRPLAEHFQADPQSIRELTKERARKRADPLPLHYAHGEKTMVRSGVTKANEWLLRKGGIDKTEAEAAKEAAKTIARQPAKPCSHKPKHLKGLCLDCYNKDLREEVQRLRNDAAATLVFDEHKLSALPRDEQLIIKAAGLAQTLEHQHDSAWDIVVSLTDITARTGDREQDWMTIGDVAARLSQLLSCPISRETVQDLTKTQTQKRNQKKGNALPFFKGHAKMMRFYRPLFEMWFDKWDKDGVGPRILGIARKKR